MRTAQDRSARKHQDRPGQAKKVGAVKDRLGQIRTDWDRSGHDNSRQVKRQNKIG